jgi:hypothetical protein
LFGGFGQAGFAVEAVLLGGKPEQSAQTLRMIVLLAADAAHNTVQMINELLAKRQSSIQPRGGGVGEGATVHAQPAFQRS